MTIRPTKTKEDEEVWVADGLGDALLGYGQQGQQTVAVYDYEKCVEIFMERDGMTEEEAIEWIDFNVMGVQPNGAGFIMMYDYFD